VATVGGDVVELLTQLVAIDSVNPSLVPGTAGEREIAELLGRCRAADPELVATSHILLAREPFETPASEPLVGTVARAAGGVLGGPAEVVGVSYWADSAFLAAAGIPTVLFGPAGDGAHAKVEWVSLSAAVACAQVLAEAAAAFCG
jgi:acetylornithine deacetylase